MSDTVISAAKKLRQRRGDTEQAIEKADSGGEKKEPSGATQKGTDLRNAKKTKHTGSKGETAYGAPIRDNQTTDSNNP